MVQASPSEYLQADGVSLCRVGEGVREFGGWPGNIRLGELVTWEAGHSLG